MNKGDFKNIVGGGVKGKGIIEHNLFEQIIGLENLFLAWDKFKQGKTKKSDVQLFDRYLEDNIFNLHYQLKNKTYQHSHYTAFYIKDPKLRKIHKATVKDRVLHHAIFRALYPIFDKTFIADSYSCRIGKGTHKAINRLEKFALKESQNKTKTIFILKCDIKKFFDSIDNFLQLKLKLFLHPDKIEIKKWHQGVDFLGYVSFPQYRLLRAKTKKRMFAKIEEKLQQLQSGEISQEKFEQSLKSYFGHLKHCASVKVKKQINGLLSFGDNKA